MRDCLHIIGLFLLFTFLAMQFPAGTLSVGRSQEPANAPFAAFVELSPASYSAYLGAARTSWQVRSESRGKPSIGRIDSDIPLLSETLPPPSWEMPAVPRHSGAPIPPPEIETYSLVPQTMGRDVAAFSVRAPRTANDHPPEETSEKPTFAREDMLSTENSRILKEIMQ